jgi:RimJ/RimL family protein N-acetyltransferase
MELKVIELQINKDEDIYTSEECQQLINIYEEYYKTISFNLPWVGYFVLDNNVIVGSCSFTGKPVDGKVEIAYWTFKEYEGHGYSSFACNALISIAQKFDPKIIITAKTAPEKNASVRILEKFGFVYSGIVQDHEIGDAWLWELN